MLSPAERRQKFWDVVRVGSGNFLAMYDFFVFGYFTTQIGKTFFPANSQLISLMLLVMTFESGYFMRPIGGLVLGAYMDRQGRRPGLILTLGLMTFGTAVIAFTPGYATAGVLGPLLVMIGRLVQGFAAGVELGGSSVYLSEIATPGNEGFYCSWQLASVQLAAICAWLLGMGLYGIIPEGEVTRWGWRIPFLIGCLITPLIMVLRRSLKETGEFEQQKHHPTTAEVLGIMVGNWKVVGQGIVLSSLTTTTFYFITAYLMTYTPTSGKQVLGFIIRDNLIVMLCVGCSNLFWLLAGGVLSDRIGRRRMLLALTAADIVTAYPALSWLVSAPSLGRLLTVELWLSFIFGMYNAAMIPFLIDIMPPLVRTCGFSLAFSCAAALFGVATPAVSIELVRVTGDPAMPGVWIIIRATLALWAAVVAKPYSDPTPAPGPVAVWKILSRWSQTKRE
ncbi:MAG: tricarballylate/proton symporter TcuC [Acetobacteraceae bacterium]|nr:tricarballylate/proton symporter TcuC [Acetobacteraceae bacterium]MBV8590519.1 tricarballylate/proton symporter TcuC [Acetobacteraceae bacterium]